ncbi:MAG TPA: SEL1-like repeat protein [Alphaproteobacteria bacterium]|jgi:TPR repeat protein
MDWTVRGMDDATKRRAQAAADADGLSLAAWLDRAILANADSHVVPPAWSEDEDVDASEADADSLLDDPEAQAAIQQVLGVLEARLQTAQDNVTRLVTPMTARLDGLTERAAHGPAADAPAPDAPVKAPPPGQAYRRGLGILAGGLLFLSFAAAGGLVWLWFDMEEPPPPSYVEADVDAVLGTPPHAAAAVDLPLPASSATAATPAATLATAAPLPALAAPAPVDITAPPDAAPAAAPDPAIQLANLDETRGPDASAADLSMAPTPAATKPPTSLTPAAAVPVAAAQPPAATPSPGDAQLVAQLRADAAKGDPKAQHDLALLLMEGRLLPKDQKTATDLFEKAAVQGLANAQYNLGVIYDHGIGRPADQTMAYFWYSAAADQGHVAAQYNLGVAAAQGRGAPRDYDVAAVWFRRAAEGGLPDAQYNLGQLYENGLGVPLDLNAAYSLYRQAADSGYTPARTRMIALESKMLPGQQPAPHGASLPPASAAPAAPPPAPTVATPPATPPQALARKDIVELQTLLRKLALTRSAPNGTLDAPTRAAIKHYQEMAGLPPTGEPSLDLLSELREVAGPN